MVLAAYKKPVHAISDFPLCLLYTFAREDETIGTKVLLRCSQRSVCNGQILEDLTIGVRTKSFVRLRTRRATEVATPSRRFLFLSLHFFQFKLEKKC